MASRTCRRSRKPVVRAIPAAPSDIDRDLVEESIDRRAQRRQAQPWRRRSPRVPEPASTERSTSAKRRRSGFFLGCAGSATSGAAGDRARPASCPSSPRLQDVDGALVAGEQVPARPRCRGRPPAPRPGPRGARGRRRRARRRRRPDRGAAPARAAGPSGGRRRQQADRALDRRRFDDETSPSGRRSSFSSTMRMTPRAPRGAGRTGRASRSASRRWRRSSTSVSSLSASATRDRRPVRSGSVVVRPLRRVVLADRVGDLRWQALAARRSSRPSRPAARGTRRPCR